MPRIVCKFTPDDQPKKKEKYEYEYKKRKIIDLDNVKDVKIGLKHTVFLCGNNDKISYFGCGCNLKGALGTNQDHYNSSILLTIMNNIWRIKNIKTFEVSWNNSLILTSNRKNLIKMMVKFI